MLPPIASEWCLWQVVVASHIEKAYKLPGREERVVALRDINISHDSEIVKKPSHFPQPNKDVFRGHYSEAHTLFACRCDMHVNEAYINFARLLRTRVFFGTTQLIATYRVPVFIAFNS